MVSWSRRRTLAALAGGGALAGAGYWIQRRGSDCLSPKDPRWTVRDSWYTRWSSPVYEDGVVYASVGYGISYTSRDEALFQIAALNDYHGGPRWAINETDGGGTTPQPHEDSVYVATGANRVYAIDRRRGTVRWRFEGGNYGTDAGSFVRPIVTDGTVVAGLEHPTRDDVSGRQAVVGLATGSGELVWSVPVEGGIQRGLCAADGVVVVATATGRFYGIDPVTGDERWTKRTDADIPHVQPATSDESVFVARASGTVLSLDASNGKRRWTAQASTSPSADESGSGHPLPVLDATDSAVLVGGVGGTVHALDPDTGENLWEADATASIAAIDTDGVRIATLDQRGIVHVLDPETGDRQMRFQVSDNSFKNRCGWLPGYERGTGIVIDEERVFVTGPWVREYYLGDL